MQAKNRSELIAIIRELRDNLQKEDDKRATFIENYETIQGKYQKVER